MYPRDPRLICSSALQKGIQYFLTSAMAAIQSQDTSLNTAEHLTVLAGDVTLLCCHKTPSVTLSTPRLCPSEGTDHHLIMFPFFTVTSVEEIISVVTSSVTGTLKNPMSEAEGTVERRRTCKAEPLRHHAAPLHVYLL